MEPMQPQQALEYLQFTLPVLKNEHKITKRMIEAVPVDKGDYCPDGVSKSAFELAWHVAAADNTFLDAAASGQFDFDKNKRPESIRNSADIAEWYEETWDRHFNRLTEMSGEHLAKLVDFRGLMQLPAVLILRLGMHHTIHHRGQLSMYLRPMGAKVPSIYGESYDDRQARLAAQTQTSTA